MEIYLVNDFCLVLPKISQESGNKILKKITPVGQTAVISAVTDGLSQTSMANGMQSSAKGIRKAKCSFSSNKSARP
ncbi:hypothetical protein D3C71_2149630 [compost metagenome]